MAEACGCQFPGGGFPSPTPSTSNPACASTTTTSSVPCPAPSYSRACLRGDPTKSPLYIERKAREEHLWTRAVTVTVAAAGVGAHTYFDVLYPAFTSSGNACVKSVGLILNDGVSLTAVPVTVVGVAGVWDFTDSTPNWTERVAVPCEAEVLDIQTTTGRCPCKVDCEGCLYPEGVGGQFMVRYRFDSITLALGDELRFTASGEHTPTPPCCQMPVLLEEVAARTTVGNIAGFTASSGRGIIQATNV